LGRLNEGLPIVAMRPLGRDEQMIAGSKAACERRLVGGLNGFSPQPRPAGYLAFDDAGWREFDDWRSKAGAEFRHASILSILVDVPANDFPSLRVTYRAMIAHSRSTR
jgi:hypothetical protein